MAFRFSRYSAGRADVFGGALDLLREEHVGMQVAPLKALCKNDLGQGFDHGRRTGSVALPAVKFGQVNPDRSMHKACASHCRLRWAGKHGRHSHVSMACGDFSQTIETI